MMKQALLKRYAELLCEYCLELKSGQRLLVQSTYLAEPLLQEVNRYALSKGATVEFLLGFRNAQSDFFELAEGDALDVVPPFYELAVKTFDAFLNLRAPFDVSELQHVDQAKMNQRNKALTAIKRLFFKRSAENDLKWTLCVYPTDSQADEADMSLEAFTQFVEDACFLHTDDPIQAWTALGKEQQVWVDFLNGCSTLRFEGDKTDLTMSVKGRKWINSNGKRNMPSGEVFSCPVETEVNGAIYFSYPTRFQGKNLEGIRFEVADGVIQRWTAEQGQDTLDKVFDLPGTRQFGEVAIGTNYHIQRATRSTLFDEKIGGSIHMAIGAAYPETGGRNVSAVHWDLVKDMKHGGRIYADGNVVYEDGQWTL